MKVAMAHPLSGVRGRLSEVVRDAFGIECLWEVGDAAGVLTRIREERPDILLLSLDLSGVPLSDLTQRIVEEAHCAILLLEGAGNGDVATVFDCLGHGATDVARLPPEAHHARMESFANFRERFSTLKTLVFHGHENEPVRSDGFSMAAQASPPLVALGASTGGPKALASVLERLPPDFPAAVIIVQHLDAHFYRGLAEWLAHSTPLPVQAVEAPVTLLPGSIYVAARPEHLVLGPEDRLCFTREWPDLVCRPSIDVLFNSIAVTPGARGAAALLTGMGRDGAEGLLALRRVGFETLAQDAASSVVYGMPRAAAELGAAVKVLPPSQMAHHIIEKIHSIVNATQASGALP
jgi:two-component system response regulator WspF